MKKLLCALALFAGFSAPALAVDITGQVELDAVFTQDAEDDSWQDRHHITVGPAWRWTETGLRVHATISSEFEGIPGIEAGFLLRPAKNVELMVAAGLARFEECETVTTGGSKHKHHAQSTPVTTEECNDEARPIYRAGAYFDLFNADETVFYLGAGVRLLDQNAPESDLAPWVSFGWRGR